jgi:hypothetical protein
MRRALLAARPRRGNHDETEGTRARVSHMTVVSMTVCVSGVPMGPGLRDHGARRGQEQLSQKAPSMVAMPAQTSPEACARGQCGTRRPWPASSGHSAC